jgi:hypothetical protein
MAYDLHIERLGEDKDGESIPIPLEEWKTAVAATPGVRLPAPGVRQETAPDGSTFNLPIQDGDVEVLFPDKNEWEYVFRWRKSIGTAAFNSRSFDPGDSSHPVWAAAVAIASRLHASIRGDDGESYDLETGEIIDA